MPAGMRAKPRQVAIVQARFGSARLPEKVLRKIGGTTILEHVLMRCREIDGIDDVVCATGRDNSNDPVAAAADRLGIAVFRGDETDVLAGYLGAARMAKADVIMRMTGDCPLIDPAICGQVLRLRAEADADYAANNMPRLFPHGLDCEAFTVEALETAARETTDPYDREHVTPWLRRHASLKRANLVGPGWPANTYRWTLDYPDDLRFFDSLFALGTKEQLGNMQGILSLLAAHPELSAINAGHAITMPRRAGTVVFRFDANRTIGSGHAMRCASLSDRFEELGWTCYWAVDTETIAFLGASLPHHRAIQITGKDALSQLAEIAAIAGKASLIILDHYSLPEGFSGQARQFADRIISFDDLADRFVDADLVINATPGVTAETYQPLVKADTKLLLGGHAAPLRRQFFAGRAAALRRTERATSIDQVLIAFGGVDPLDGTSLAIDAAVPLFAASRINVVLGSRAPHLSKVKKLVEKHRQAGVSIALLQDVADMAGLLAQSDLCIGAPGTSTWERCCLGVPSLLVGIAENQRANAAVMGQSGGAIICGFLTTDPREMVAQALTAALRKLQAAPPLRANMAAIATALSDGRGIDRILAASLPALRLANGMELSLRLMEPSDEDLLLAWQAAPETRRYAANPQVPTANEHHAWFAAKLLAPADLPLIAEIAGRPAGYVRLDWRGDHRGSPIYLVSIATAPDQYRQGIGSAMLRLAWRLAPGAIFMARILPGNAASIGLFQRLGYELQADGYYHSLPGI